MPDSCPCLWSLRLGSWDGRLWVEFMASGFREFIDGGVSRPAPSSASAVLGGLPFPLSEPRDTRPAATAGRIVNCGTAKHCGQPNSNQNCETHRLPFLPPRKWTMYYRALARNRHANSIFHFKPATGHPGKLNIRTNGLKSSDMPTP